MAHIGRPKWIPSQEAIEKVEAFAARGLTEAEIAHCLGISVDTFVEKKKAYSEFSSAIKRGRAKGISLIANKLFEDAKLGNTTAQIFFLKCRAGWREISVMEHTGPDGGPIRGKFEIVFVGPEEAEPD